MQDLPKYDAPSTVEAKCDDLQSQAEKVLSELEIARLGSGTVSSETKQHVCRLYTMIEFAFSKEEFSLPANSRKLGVDCDSDIDTLFSKLGEALEKMLLLLNDRHLGLFGWFLLLESPMKKAAWASKFIIQK